MKYLFSVSALLALVIADPGFVKLPLSRETTNGTHPHGHARRSVNDKLQNDVVQYFVDIALGTPGQSQHVSIDTGSSDLWVFGPDSGAQQYYDPSQSSTAKYVDDGFSISYVDGSGAQGDYYTDDTSLGGANVNFQFAVANAQGGSGYGVFGIAATLNEADTEGRYANYPVALKQQGIIESTAYSLYLDDINASSGSLLFGGVDTGRYNGQLYYVPITSDISFNVDFEVAGYKLNGVLDAGTSFTYLPDDFVQGLAQKYHGQYDDVQGVYYVPQVYDDELTYNFSGVEVTVPSSELFIQYNGHITLSVAPASAAGNNILLGDSFLRSAYVVYDLDNSQVAIAQASYGGSGRIEPITSAGIPGAKPAPGL